MIRWPRSLGIGLQNQPHPCNSDTGLKFMTKLTKKEKKVLASHKVLLEDALKANQDLVRKGFRPPRVLDRSSVAEVQKRLKEIQVQLSDNS